ncbi:MAG: MgtC/SapB family protein [Ruminococcaceae bacterium]|nr:MgtC/SapB family protein [Oscillospiraceae bacterium]
MQLREVTLLAIVLRILAAVICGGIIGLERELKNRPAGLRTYMLVCLGSCLIMLTNQYIYQVTASGDPMRLGAQVVSGIGFLGAGTIIVTRHNQIKGLTTAAGLWSSAGVGLALGVGFYEAALVAGVAIFTILTLLQYWDNHINSKTKAVEIYIVLDEDVPLGDFIHEIRQLGLKINNIQIDGNGSPEEGARGFLATLRSPKRCDHDVLIENVKKIKGVSYLEEL